MLDISLSVQDFEFFLLIFTRITTFLVSAPFFSTANIPYRTKAGFGFFSSMLIYQFVVPHYALSYSTVWGYGILVLKEAIVGVVIGLGCNLVLAIMTFAGKIIDMEVGLSMVNIYDPTTRISEGFSGMFYHYMVLLMLLISGMHHYLIRAFVDAYQLIPTGGIQLQAEKFVPYALGFLRDYMVIGFRICLPIFATMLLVNAILGILAKIAPQMNMFAVGMQIKVLLGLTVLFLTASLTPGIADFIYTETKRMMVSGVELFH